MRICSLLLLLAACHKTAAEEAVPALPVQVAAVAKGEIARNLEVAGTLLPPPGWDVKLAPLVPGRLSQVLVAEGDKVRKDQPLARLEATPLRDALTQAEASLSQARAQAANAGVKLSRAAQAFDAGVAAGQEVDDARLTADSSQAQVHAAEAAVSTARNQLARGELRAPFDGVVAKIFAASGEPVDPSKTVVEIARTEVLELHAPVSPELAAVLKPGQHATIDGADGVLLAVAPTVDAATGALMVRVRVPNAAGAFKANAMARARITVDLHHDALLVPKAAVFGSGTVELVEQGKARAVPVKVGYDDGEHVEIVEGLKEGDQIIVQGGYAIPDGTAVTAAPKAEK
ncbi:MAG TPA: efflux RND transporter periplasmic adaptor subunit [Myxococcales bacterium]|nr:efflux RND transporter periplasmic adaptor subunit [Myxococcales bacterium]